MFWFQFFKSRRSGRPIAIGLYSFSRLSFITCAVASTVYSDWAEQKLLLVTGHLAY